MKAYGVCTAQLALINITHFFFFSKINILNFSNGKFNIFTKKYVIGKSIRFIIFR